MQSKALPHAQAQAHARVYTPREAGTNSPLVREELIAAIHAAGHTMRPTSVLSHRTTTSGTTSGRSTGEVSFAPMLLEQPTKALPLPAADPSPLNGMDPPPDPSGAPRGLGMQRKLCWGSRVH